MAAKGSKSGRKAKAAQGASDAVDAPVVEVKAEAAPPVKPAAKGRKGDATLGEVTAGYLRHLESEGKSPGTQFSYSMDLKAATAVLGEDTPVSTLTPAKVQAFFESDGVTKKRNGKKKSSITIAKTCRVLRLALVWAAEKGMIEKAPIPVEEKAKA